MRSNATSVMRDTHTDRDTDRDTRNGKDPVSESRETTLGQLSRDGHCALSALLLLVLAAYLTTSIHEPLVYWHLSLGNWILYSKLLPTQNHFTYVGQQLEFYSSSWLFDAILASLHYRFEFISLLILKMVLLSVVLGVLARTFYRYSNSLFFSGFLVAAISAGLLPRSQLTPDLFGYIFFTIICDWLLLVRRGQATTGYVLAIFPLSVFAANMNVQIVVASSLIVGISVFFKTAHLGDRAEAARQTTLLFLLLLAAALLTPYRADDMVYVVHAVLAYCIAQVVTGADFGNILHFPTAVLSLITAATFIINYQQETKKPWITASAKGMAALLLVALVADSLAPYALIAAGVLLAQLAHDGVASLGPLGIGIERLAFRLGRFPALASVFFIFCVLVVLVQNRLRSPESNLLLPKTELEYLLSESALRKYRPIYHRPEFAGYVYWRMREHGGGLAASAIATTAAYPRLRLLENKMNTLDDGWSLYFSQILYPRSALVEADTAEATMLAKNVSWCEVTGFAGEWRLFLKKSKCPSYSPPQAEQLLD